MDLIDNYSSDEDSESAAKVDSRNNVPCKSGVVTMLPLEESLSDTFDRAVRHVHGCWAGHIFLSVPDHYEEEEWKQRAAIATERLRVGLSHAGWSGDVYSHNEFHISLSRPFFLQNASIEPFQRELALAIRHERAMVLQTCEEVILSNEKGTRSFLAWKLTENHAISRLVRLIDSVLIRYQQQVFNNPPLFHVTVASFRGKPPPCLGLKLANGCVHEIPDSLGFYARKLSCTFGNVKRIDLILLT